MVKIKSAAHDIQFHLDEADVPHVKKILDRAHQMGLFKDDQTSHYMDRQTGRLAGFFRPRCARPLRP